LASGSNFHKMSRRIVICPSFAESHLLRCWIPNMVATLNPDIIIINEGLFSKGPEDKTAITDEFRLKWIGDLESNTGFDWDETVEIVQDEDKSIWGHLIKQPISIRLHPMKYENLSADECFIKAMTYTTTDNPLNFDFSYGDLIFNLEPDAFLREDQSDLISEIVDKLKPGEGVSVEWIDFLETQFYREKINVKNPKFRRFCYRFDTKEKYIEAINGFMSQSYPKLKKVTDFFIFHYAWFRPGKFKELRYELIYRADPAYWRNFDIGLEWIKLKSKIFVKRQQKGDLKYEEPEDIMIRPSRNDDGKYATFVNMSHPKHIQTHENWIK